MRLSGKTIVAVGVSVAAALSPLCRRATAGADVPMAAQAYGEANQPVRALSDGRILCEAEEFQVRTPGWEAAEWGTNYYAATLANTFLSRKAYLGAPPQCDEAVASLVVEVPEAGRYLALVRYEAAYRFETQFRVRIEQNGRTVLDRLYGARENLKIWPFRQGLKKEVAWNWGAVENVVWEGHDAYVDLDAGPASIDLIASAQPEPAARRNVDLVMLTTDEEQVKDRIAKENYLPLDGWLTQEGDVYVRLHNAPDGSSMKLTVPSGREHSPYWVHMRAWRPKTLEAAPGASTDWVEVGSLLDTLNDGQWILNAAADGPLHYRAEFGVRTPGGAIESVGAFESRSASLALAYDANTRYTRHVRLQDEVLYELVEYLKEHPVRGRPPLRTLIYGYTFDPHPGDPRYTAARDEFIRMMALTGLMERDPAGETGPPMPNGYTDLRGNSPQQLEQICKRMQQEGTAENMAVVSLGDEIGLSAPPADAHEQFREWLQRQGLKPSDLDPGAGDDWARIRYSPAGETAKTNPRLYYHSQRFAHAYGIQSIKALTDVLRRYLPNAGVGANFSPHHHNAYLGATHQWIKTFREEGMTLPWSEDYIWQVPVCSQQVNFILLDTFRCGLKNRPEGKIIFYVMPHWPGNTPNSWRRQFYGDVMHGMKIVNLFEVRPVQAAYTENHVSLPEMYLEIRRAFYEMGLFEDIMQSGRVRPGKAALWWSETGDIWGDYENPFAAAKRCLYVAILHTRLPLDIVLEDDAPGGGLAPYDVLYLTERHVTRAASRAIAQWVADGGRLFATAGAGMLDEYDRPNPIMRELLGVDQTELDVRPDVHLAKQDLPFAEPMDTVTLVEPEGHAGAKVPVIGARSRFRVNGADVIGTFADGSPAVASRAVGRGTALYCGFLPGLSYFKPAIPRRPVDRGATDDAMSHFIPTAFDGAAAALIALPGVGVERPVVCSEALVEAGVVESDAGILIPLVNWSGKPVEALAVEVSLDLPANDVSLASGSPVRTRTEAGRTVFTLDLNVADALILR